MSEEDGVDVDREEIVWLNKHRLTHVAEMALTFGIIAVAGLPVALATESPLAGAATGALVASVIQEALWRYRGLPELAPSRRFKDAIR